MGITSATEIVAVIDSVGWLEIRIEIAELFDRIAVPKDPMRSCDYDNGNA